MSSGQARIVERAGRLPGASLLLAAVALAVYLFPSWAPWLEYDRRALAGGELWRLPTSHWTHWGGEHLAWDLVTFLVLAVPCELLDRRRMLVTLGAAAIAIAPAIWIFLPELELYRGLSGLDASLFALFLGLVRQRLRREGRSGAWPVAALAVLAAKVVYETVSGDALFVAALAPGVVVVPLAHLVGGAVGWVVALDRGRVPLATAKLLAAGLVIFALSGCEQRRADELIAVERRGSVHVLTTSGGPRLVDRSQTPSVASLQVESRLMVCDGSGARRGKRGANLRFLLLRQVPGGAFPRERLESAG